MQPLPNGPNSSSQYSESPSDSATPVESSKSKVSAEELEKTLRKIQVRAYQMAKAGQWKELYRLTENIELKRDVLGSDFIEKTADFRPRKEDLSILHVLCAQGAPKKLLEAWLRFSKDKEAEAPVTFQLGKEKLSGRMVRPIHLALVTGNVDAIEALHEAKCDIKGQTSTGDSVRSLFKLIEPYRIYTLKMLMRCGVDPFEAEKGAASLFSQTLDRKIFAETLAILKDPAFGKIIRKDADRSECYKLVLGPVVRAFLSALSEPKYSAHADDLLRLIERLAQPEDREFFKKAFNVTFKRKETAETVPVIHAAILHKRAMDLVPRLLHLGANPNDTGSYAGVGNTTAVHLACELAIPGLVTQLKNAGANMTAKNELGETPQELFVKKVLLEKPLNSEARSVNATVKEIFGKIEVGVAEVFALFSGNKKFAHGLEILLSMAELEDVVFVDDMEDFEDIMMLAPLSTTSLLFHGRYSRSSFNLSFAHHVLLLRTANELQSDGGDSKSFTEMLPHLLTRYEPEAAHMLARRFESQMDSGHRSKAHANLVELMALINHPKDPDLDPQKVGPIITALTSASRYGFAPNGRVVRNWGKIGSYSFSFGFWKYDAMRVGGSDGQCLLEDYGFERCPSRVSDNFITGDKHGKHWFGPGFWMPPGKSTFAYRKRNPKGEVEYKRFNSKTSAEFRRSYVSVSHPEYGTLVVRNSSRDFGRDLFKYPAYWSRQYYPGPIPDAALLEICSNENKQLLKQALSGIPPIKSTKPPAEAKDALLAEDDIVNILNDGADAYPAAKPGSHGFKDVTEQQLYQHDQNGRNSPAVAIEFLLEQLYALKQDYAGWKFDTRLETAWQDWDEYGVQLNGGYHSKGFANLVSLLKDKVEKEAAGGPPAPDLAFVHGDYPPWSEYRYFGPQGQASRLKVTPKVVEVLEALSKGEAKESDLEETGIRKFFQEAGFNTQGELVMLDGVKTGTEEKRKAA